MSINRVVVSGNLTRDPELRMAGSTPCLNLGIAVNDRKKNNDTGAWEDVPNFFDAVVWGARGESLSRFLAKGTKVVISGRLKWSQWETSAGDKRSKVEIVADDVEFMTTTNNNGSGGYRQAQKTDDAFSEDIPF